MHHSASCLPRGVCQPPLMVKSFSIIALEGTLSFVPPYNHGFSLHSFEVTAMVCHNGYSNWCELQLLHFVIPSLADVRHPFPLKDRCRLTTECVVITIGVRFLQKIYRSRYLSLHRRLVNSGCLFWFAAKPSCAGHCHYGYRHLRFII